MGWYFYPQIDVWSQKMMFVYQAAAAFKIWHGIYPNIDDEPEEKWANDFINNQQDNFFGWLCGVGLEGIEINANGTIHRGVCGVGGNISHVDDEDWKLPKNFIVCNRTRCTCVADWKSTKYKSNAVRSELKESVAFEIYKRKGSLDSRNY